MTDRTPTKRQQGHPLDDVFSKLYSDKYNGWTNYATWRVNLEIIDGMDAESFGVDPNDKPDISDVADAIQSFVLAKDYANAFISDVESHVDRDGKRYTRIITWDRGGGHKSRLIMRKNLSQN